MSVPVFGDQKCQLNRSEDAQQRDLGTSRFWFQCKQHPVKPPRWTVLSEDSQPEVELLQVLTWGSSRLDSAGVFCPQIGLEKDDGLVPGWCHSNSFKWCRLTQATAVYSSVELAKNREAKSIEEGKDVFLSELPERPPCSNLGLDHRFFRAAQSPYGGKKSVMDGMATSLNEVGNLVLCEAVWYSG